MNLLTRNGFLCGCDVFIKPSLGKSVRDVVDFDLLWNIGVYVETQINYPIIILTIDPGQR